MPWNTISIADITAELLLSEVTALETIQGGNDVLGAVLTRVIAELQARILAAGNQIDQPGTMPDQLRGAAIAIARWEWFNSLPKTDLQSQFRKDANDTGQKRFDQLMEKGYKVELPTNPQNIAGPANRVQVTRRGHHVRTNEFDKIGET